MSDIAEEWQRLYFRCSVKAGEVDLNASWSAVEGTGLIDFTRLGAVGTRFKERAREILRSFDKEEGLFVLLVEPGGYMDLQLEFEDFTRWGLSSATGRPEGFETQD